MNKLILALIITFSQMIFCSLIHANPYEGYFSKFVNGVERKFSYSEDLQNKSTDGLTQRSLEIHLNTLAVYQNPTNEEAKTTFIQSFPSKFEEFLRIFHSPKFDQLYDTSFISISLLDKLGDEYPKLVAPKLMDLAKDACFDADAPNQFRMVIREFKEKHPSIYSSELNKLSKQEKLNLSHFYKASFHPHENSVGFCK